MEGLVVSGGLSQQVVFRCHGILRSLVGKLGASSPGEQVLRSFEAILSRLVATVRGGRPGGAARGGADGLGYWAFTVSGRQT